MNLDTIDKFKKYFDSLPLSEVSQLEEFYAADIQFKDPVRSVKGMEGIKVYYEMFNANLVQGGYKFTQQSILHDKAYLSWELELEFKTPAKRTSVSGITVLLVGDKIISHRNYYDAGALYYENLPLVGPVIRLIKKQICRYC